MRKKILSLMLTAVMLISMLPTSVQATDLSSDQPGDEQIIGGGRSL